MYCERPFFHENFMRNGGLLGGPKNGSKNGSKNGQNFVKIFLKISLENLVRKMVSKMMPSSLHRYREIFFSKTLYLSTESVLPAWLRELTERDHQAQ